MINLYLGTINRSGGSLFCRLLDGHPDVASYPKEVSFPDNHMIAPDIERIAGIPRYIPIYDKINNNNKSALELSDPHSKLYQNVSERLSSTRKTKEEEESPEQVFCTLKKKKKKNLFFPPSRSSDQKRKRLISIPIPTFIPISCYKKTKIK